MSLDANIERMMYGSRWDRVKNNLQENWKNYLWKGTIYTSLLFTLATTACSGLIGKTKEETKETVPITQITQVPETTVVETTAPETKPVSFYDNIDEKIRFNVEDGMFPDFWYKAPYNAKAESLNPSEIERSKNILIKVLKKYPEDVLAKNLSKIYVLNYLGFYGVEAGGTDSLDSVYLENKGENNGFDSVWIEKIFHAEFSSILLVNYNSLFNKQAWININPNDFKYVSDTGIEAVINGKDSSTFDPKLNEIGFLYEYAQSSLENDFNSFAKNIFVNDTYFWEAIDKYPKIKAKNDLVIDFYNKINPKFTLAYFKQISQQ